MFAVLWGFLAFAGGSDDEGIPIEDAEDTTTTEAEARTTEAEGRTTASRRAPTTTTTLVLPGAPLLGEPTGLALAVVGGSSRVVDLDTGGVTRVFEQVLGATVRGLLVQGQDGIETWPPPYDGSGSTTILPFVPDAMFEQIWIVGDGHLVWSMARPDDMTGFGPTFSMSLVDLDGGLLGRFELPAEVWPVGATDHGLVVTGPGGVYLMDADGRAARVSTGDPIGVVGEWIHVTNCDEDLRCQVEVFDERGRLVDEQPRLNAPLGWGTAAPDGRVAYIEYRGEFGEESVVTIDGTTVYERSGSLPGVGAPNGLAWSPDGRWLAIAAQDGLHVLDTLGDGGEQVIDPGFVSELGSVYWVEQAG